MSNMKLLTSENISTGNRSFLEVQPNILHDLACGKSKHAIVELIWTDK